MAVICFYLFTNRLGYIVKRTNEGYSHVDSIHSSRDIYYSFVDTVLWARQEAVWSLPEEVIFLLSKTSRANSGGQPVTYTKSIRGSFPVIKWAGREANRSCLFSAEAKNEWSYTFTPPHGRHRDNFTITDLLQILNINTTSTNTNITITTAAAVVAVLCITLFVVVTVGRHNLKDLHSSHVLKG